MLLERYGSTGYELLESDLRAPLQSATAQREGSEPSHLSAHAITELVERERVLSHPRCLSTASLIGLPARRGRIGYQPRPQEVVVPLSFGSRAGASDVVISISNHLRSQFQSRLSSINCLGGTNPPASRYVKDVDGPMRFSLPTFLL